MAPGVTRNPSAARIVDLSGVGVGCVVVSCTNNHAVGPGEHCFQRSPAKLSSVVPRFEILHISGMALGDPFGEAGEFRKFGYWRYAGQVESRLQRRLLHRGRDTVSKHCVDYRPKATVSPLLAANRVLSIFLLNCFLELSTAASKRCSEKNHAGVLKCRPE